MDRAHIGLALFAAAMSLPAASADPANGPEAHQTRAIGGSGGGTRTLSCRSDLLGGVGIRQGALVDRIWPLCVRVTPSGTWDGAPVARPGLEMGGMGGGGPYNLVCPPNFYVQSINVQVDRGAASGGAVRSLTLYCMDSAAQQTRVVQAPRTASFADTGDGVSCPSGHLANGIGGASGQVVDRLGLLCIRSPVKHAAPVIKRMGRPNPG